MNDDDRTPVDWALDLLVYAPLGLALEARSLLPRLVERGRQQVTGQVTMARVVGQFAVQQGRVEAEKRLATVWEQAEGLLASRNGAPSPAPSAPPDAASAAPEAPAPVADEGAPAAEPPPPAEPPTAPRSAPDAGRLAIPDYDSLSASQVVPRLAGLSPDELEAVRAYEAETRGRKTILNRIVQLQR